MPSIIRTARKSFTLMKPLKGKCEEYFDEFGKDSANEQASDIRTLTHQIETEPKLRVFFGSLEVPSDGSVSANRAFYAPEIGNLPTGNKWPICVMILDISTIDGDGAVPQLVCLSINGRRSKFEFTGKNIIKYRPPIRRLGTKRYCIIGFNQLDGDVDNVKKFKKRCTKYNRFRYQKVTNYFNFQPVRAMKFYVTDK
ncbi:hypothetical protein ACOME3_005119 [Neoechinorhynchus agilis]